MDEAVLALVAVHNAEREHCFSEADLHRLLGLFKDQTHALTLNQVQLVTQQHIQAQSQHESLARLHQRLEFQANNHVQAQLESHSHMQPKPKLLESTLLSKLWRSASTSCNYPLKHWRIDTLSSRIVSKVVCKQR